MSSSALLDPPGIALLRFYVHFVAATGHPGLNNFFDIFFPFQASELRKSESYIRWYSLGVNSVVMIVVPTVVMIYCSWKVESIT